MRIEGHATSEIGEVTMRRRPGSGDHARFPDAFGTARIGAGWIGIGIAAAAFLAVGAALLSVGAPAALLAVGPILLVMALACATTRQVALDLARGEVVRIRRLGRLSWVRRLPLRQVARVAVAFSISKPRHSASDGTLAGDQIHGCYDLWLLGLIRLRLATFWAGGDPPAARDAAEGLALALAGRLGVPAERQGYQVERWRDGRLVSAPARGHAEPIPGDARAASDSLERRLAEAGHAPPRNNA